MAISRFRTQPQPLDPTIYQYYPEEFLPDLTNLAKVTSGLQQAYDASDKIPIPKHLDVDAQDVQERYLKPIKSLKQEAIDSFASGNVGDGLRGLKKLQTHIYEAKQPGGVYEQYERNYASAQNYNKQLDEMYEKGNISSEKRDALKSLSISKFPGSFDQQGGFRAFEGITAAQDVALGEAALKAAQGWASDQVASGALKLDPSTGTYLYSNTREFVDFREVKKGVKNVLMQSDENMAFLRQAAKLRGLTGDKANEFIDTQLDVAAESAALKEGFVKDKKQFYRNWSLEQSREHNFQKALSMGQLSSNIVTIATGMKPLDINKEGKISKGFKEGTAAFGSSYYSGTERTQTPQYVDIGLDEALKSNPNLAKEYPGLAEVVALIPRHVADENGHPTILSAADYNRKIKEAYDDLAKRKSETSFGLDTFEDPKQIDDAAKVMDAQFGLRAYTLISPNKAPQTLTPDKLLDMLSLKSPDDFSKRFKPVGVTRADSPWGMNSYFMAGTSSDGSRFNVIASPTSEKAMNYAQPYIDLLRPNWDMATKETQPVPIYNPKTGVTKYYKSNRVMEYDEESGKVRENVNFYEAQLDENGDVEIWNPTNLTVEEVTEAATLSNPFHPAKRIK